MEYARKAAQLTIEMNAKILDTLAMACAINRSFKNAIETERKALSETKIGGEPKRLENSKDILGKILW